MQTKLVIFLFLVLVGCNISSTKQHSIAKRVKKDILTKKPSLYFSDTGFSTILLRRDFQDGFPEIEEISHSESFHFIEYSQYFSGGIVVMYALIKELSIQRIKNAPSDYGNGKIILKANIPKSVPIQDQSNLYRIDWIDILVANKIHYRKQFIEALQYRDDKNPVRKIIDYFTGKTIMELSSQLYGLQQLDGYNRRFIGYLEMPSATNHSDFGIDRDLYGVFSYADPISLKVQYLKLETEQDFSPNSLWRDESFNGISIERVQANPANGDFKIDNTNYQKWEYSDFRNFYVVLKFTGARTIKLKIHIHNDQIDTSDLHSNSFDFRLEIRGA